MRYLHTMVRVADPEAAIRFFTLLGLKETRRMENQAGRYTLIYLAADEDFRGDGEIAVRVQQLAGLRVAMRVVAEIDLAEAGVDAIGRRAGECPA